MVGPSNSDDLISSLDMGNPLHLQNSDLSSSTIAFVKLTGLNDVYQPIRSSLLSRETFPDVKDAFAIIFRQESHRGIASSSVSVPKLQTTNFMSMTNFFDNNNENKRFDNRRVNNSGNNTVNTSGTINLILNLGLSQISKPNAELNHNTSRDGAPLSFTNEQMMKLMSLINDVPSGANQHMTVSTKNMFGIIDISDLNLTIGHPNGILAKIKYVGNLQLSKNVILYDVLVVPKYCVSLLSVHKLVRDTRMFVGFNEHECYIHDLNQNKNIRTGRESGGLYLFDLHAIQDKGCNTPILIHSSES
ncbi:hypothetical protein Tco_0936870 [Tanacetum coccineum]|uniref:Uncharacterized protein n=1 Tax=Tanacetum coccineum TaxID=301880 RepID=A0ABQ5DCM0_9ASTR